MIGYVTLGTNDLEKSVAYYDELLALLGGKRFMEDERFIAWNTEGGGTSLAVIKPFDEQVASVGNGVMVALVAADKDTVKAVYQKALALGGTDEGKPGQRGDGFYAGYFRDLDGNKLNVFCFT